MNHKRPGGTAEQEKDDLPV